eukprot:jgi/Tetstr1/466924/TSEL_011378.t1
MADRGRRARPISSRICDQKYQDYCDKLHKERLQSMKGRSDHSRPHTMSLTHMQTGNNAKKNYIASQRLKQINLDNTRLLDKMAEINQTKIEFKPWYARASLGFKPGYYYDSRTAQAVTDHHLKLQPSQPRGGESPYAKKTKMLEIMKENHKILGAIQHGKPMVRFDKFEEDHHRVTERLKKCSMYHGPESHRYMPKSRIGSARTPGRFSGLYTRTAPTTPASSYMRGSREAGMGLRPETAPDNMRRSAPGPPKAAPDPEEDPFPPPPAESNQDEAGPEASAGEEPAENQE